MVSARWFPKLNHEEFSEGVVDFNVYSSKKLLAHSIRRCEEGRVLLGSDDFGSALLDAQDQECLLQVVSNVAEGGIREEDNGLNKAGVSLPQDRSWTLGSL